MNDHPSLTQMKEEKKINNVKHLISEYVKHMFNCMF